MTAEISSLIDAYALAGTRLEALMNSIPPDRLAAKADGGWSAQEIVCHLADSEAVGSYRFRLAAAEPGTTIEPYDQDVWSERLRYSGLDARDAAAVFIALRRYNTGMLRALPESAWAHTITHTTMGILSLRALVEVYIDHADQHLADLDSQSG